MKNSTKLKIIRWVERLLKYEQPNQPPTITKTIFDIQEVKWETTFRLSELITMTSYKLEDIIAKEITKCISDAGVIEIKQQRDDYNDEVRVSAKALFLKP